MKEICGWIFCIWFVSIIQECVGERCYEYDDYGFQRRSLWCSNDCCGTTTYRYCCSDFYDPDDSDVWDPVGLIIGVSVGSLLLLGLIITCCVCICIKNKGTSGRVVAPVSMGPAIIMAQTHQGSNNGYSYGPQTQYPGIGLSDNNAIEQAHYPLGPSQTTSQGFTTNPLPPPSYLGAVGGAYPGTTAEKAQES